MTTEGRTMNNVKETFFNESQALVHIINANVTHSMWPRGEGKTSGGSGRRLVHLSQTMPRSQSIIYTDTFKRSEEVLIPNILGFLSDEMGLIEEQDYVVFQTPPKHWVKPLIPLKKFNRVVSFNTGFALCCGASNEDGSVNGFSGQSGIIEETKYVDQKRIKSQLYKALRGGLKYFGHLPEYRSVWSFTDKYEGDVDWLLKLRAKQDISVINAVLSMQLEVWRLHKEMEQCKSTATQYKYKRIIFEKEQKLTAIRKELVFISDAKPFANKDILGEKFYRDARRDCDTIYEYKVAILNQDPDQVQNSYYPKLSKLKHFYKLEKDQVDQVDNNENQPLSVAMDYQWRITPLVAGQPGIIPGKVNETFNIVNCVHTVHPNGGTKKTVKAFCEFYKDRAEKTVYYVYDHTATNRHPDYDSFKDIAIKEWEANGWYVVEVELGQAPEQDIKHEDIKNAMDEDKFLFNEIAAEPVVTSMKHAGAIKQGKKTKKDKSQEKKKNDPVKQTDYSDAFDMLAMAYLRGLIPNDKPSFIGDIYTK